MEKAKIMIVEDEAITALDLKSRLKRAGYNVVATVSSGEAAISTAAERNPDLVLMDIRLNGDIDGITAAQSIRARYGTPVIYLTAHADDETLQRAKVTQPHGYLLKPFEEKEIRTTIEMALYKHQMECKLHKSEQWLSTTLRSIGDAVVATDANGCVRFMNPVAEALTGWAEKDAIGQDLAQVFVILKEETLVPVPDPVVMAMHANAVVELEKDCVLRSKHGSLVPIDDSAAPMRDESGQVVGGVLVFRDITERRQAEDAIRQYTAELEVRNQELDAFAHTVAHDLKAPLNLIIGFAELIETDHSHLSQEDLASFLRIIATNGARMNNIVDELLLLSEVRKHEAETRPVDMGSVVSAATERLAHLIEDSGATVRVPDAWPIAQGYAPWLEEVWVNYLSNALKYGGEPPLIELGASLHGRTIRFWVRDNGTGITPENQARLFTPYTRLDQVRAKGHGLGLSVVRRIMDKLDGDVGVESSGMPGEGSLFYFSLPQAPGFQGETLGDNGHVWLAAGRREIREAAPWTSS